MGLNLTLEDSGTRVLQSPPTQPQQDSTPLLPGKAIFQTPNQHLPSASVFAHFHLQEFSSCREVSYLGRILHSSPPLHFTPFAGGKVLVEAFFLFIPVEVLCQWFLHRIFQVNKTIRISQNSALDSSFHGPESLNVVLLSLAFQCLLLQSLHKFFIQDFHYHFHKG